jgi:hypothetical protein
LVGEKKWWYCCDEEVAKCCVGIVKEDEFLFLDFVLTRFVSAICASDAVVRWVVIAGGAVGGSNGLLPMLPSIL